MTVQQYEKRLYLIVSKNVYLLKQIYNEDYYKHFGDRVEFLWREFKQESKRIQKDDNITTQ